MAEYSRLLQENDKKYGDDKMNILHYISGPLIGAVIGYCTNYIAVKMLFRPHKAIRIGRFTLPFTPGIIPKRQNDLASAVGKAVGNALLTEEDLTNMLLSEDVEYSVTGLCISQIQSYLSNDQTLGDTIPVLLGQDAYAEGKEQLQQVLCEKVMNGIKEMEPGRLIAEEGKKAVQQKLEGTMFSMFLSDKLLDSLAGEIGDYAENYIMENGPSYVEAQIEKEITGIEGKPLSEAVKMIPVNKENVCQKVREVYRVCIQRFAGTIVKQFHIADIVENKIREMDVNELEDLVMSVMKNELGMIVNLGALIGLILGILNLFF